MILARGVQCLTTPAPKIDPWLGRVVLVGGGDRVSAGMRLIFCVGRVSATSFEQRIDLTRRRKDPDWDEPVRTSKTHEMSKSENRPPNLRAATRLLKEKSAAAAEALAKTTSEAGGLARRATRSLTESGPELWDSLRDRYQDTTGALWRSSKDAVAALLPQKRVKVFLLPTGRGKADFFCVLDFKEVVDQLAGGFFVRPCLEVWAAREDVDRRALSAHLREDFTVQLNQERRRRAERVKENFSPVLKRLDEDKKRAGSLVEKATFAFTSSLLLMFFVANPVFDVIFLVLAVFSGAGGLTKSLRYLQLAGRLRSSEKGLEKQEEALENELDSKGKEFTDAVANLEIRVHPVLERILVHISDLDGEPFVPGQVSGQSEDLPDVVEFLRRPEYRAALRELYHPLVDAELTSRNIAVI